MAEMCSNVIYIYIKTTRECQPPLEMNGCLALSKQRLFMQGIDAGSLHMSFQLKLAPEKGELCSKKTKNYSEAFFPVAEFPQNFPKHFCHNL